MKFAREFKYKREEKEKKTRNKITVKEIIQFMDLFP